jgi:hypothetical protein
MVKTMSLSVYDALIMSLLTHLSVFLNNSIRIAALSMLILSYFENIVYLFAHLSYQIMSGSEIAALYTFCLKSSNLVLQ